MSVIPPMCNPIYANLVGNQLENNNNSSTGNAKISVGSSAILKESEKTAIILIPKSLGQTNFEKLLKDQCLTSMNISTSTAVGFFSNFEPKKIFNLPDMHNH